MMTMNKQFIFERRHEGILYQTVYQQFEREERQKIDERGGAPFSGARSMRKVFDLTALKIFCVPAPHV
jgi:hypothetical protein